MRCPARIAQHDITPAHAARTFIAAFAAYTRSRLIMPPAKRQRAQQQRGVTRRVVGSRYACRARFTSGAAAVTRATPPSRLLPERA